jgi:hypothetical protein
MAVEIISGRKVRVSPEGVASFNRAWPCSTLRASRAYWFEFDSRGDLIDTDCPESDDGPAALALAEDCKAYLFNGTRPIWAA